MKTTKKPKTTTVFNDDENSSNGVIYLEDVSAFFGFCGCLFQLFILTRKELRSDFVFIFIASITLCDFLFCSGTLLWTFIDYLAEDVCSKKYLYIHQVVRVGVVITQQMARNLSIVFIVLVSTLKILTVKLNSLMAIWISVWVHLVYIVWSIWSTFHYKIELVEVNFKKCPTVLSYYFSIDPNFYDFQQSVNDKITISLFALLSIVFVVNFIKLLLAGCSQQSGKHIHSMFLAMLSLSFFVAESLSFCLFLLDTIFLRDYLMIPAYFDQLITSIFTLLGIVWRCSLCHLASPDYAATARKYLKSGGSSIHTNNAQRA